MVEAYRNAVTQNFLKNSQGVVFTLKSPNGQHTVYLSPETLFRTVESNRVRTLNGLKRLIMNKNKTGQIIRRPNRENYPGQWLGQGVAIPVTNYVFEKFLGEYGRPPVRDPVHGRPLKLSNLGHEELNKNILRSLRAASRNEARNLAASTAAVMNQVRLNAANRARRMAEQEARAAGPQSPGIYVYTPNASRQNIFYIFNSAGRHLTNTRIQNVYQVPRTANFTRDVNRIIETNPGIAISLMRRGGVGSWLTDGTFTEWRRL